MPKMPPMPAAVMLPTETAHGYWPATVVAAVPRTNYGEPYAVTAISPTSSPDAPEFIAALACRSIHGFWIAESDDPFRTHTLDDALARMNELTAD